MILNGCQLHLPGISIHNVHRHPRFRLSASFFIPAGKLLADRSQHCEELIARPTNRKRAQNLCGSIWHSDYRFSQERSVDSLGVLSTNCKNNFCSILGKECSERLGLIENRIGHISVIKRPHHLEELRGQIGNQNVSRRKVPLDLERIVDSTCWKKCLRYFCVLSPALVGEFEKIVNDGLSALMRSAEGLHSVLEWFEILATVCGNPSHQPAPIVHGVLNMANTLED
mmetsp:Transcript_68926/g.143687  ORF Transcript_68926/g.143687 Transcript_68926/m.143687 type:complete len:227 (-) Transcript_68926:1362-2042(-)